MGARADPRADLGVTALRQPSVDFAGPVYAKWVPPDLVRGLRIAVIGDAAALAQVVPSLVGAADFVKVFQDGPAWAGPSWASSLPRTLQRRIGVRALRATVRDPWLRWQLTPHNEARSSGLTGRYVRALQADTCKLIIWPIAGYVPEGIRTADGIEHHVDAIVLA